MAERRPIGDLFYAAGAVPPALTRLRAAAALADELAGGGPALVADTGPAALYGALPAGVADAVLVNVGNGHTICVVTLGGRLAGVFEHHTRLLDGPGLEQRLRRFLAGDLGSDEVREDGGHGAVLARGGRGDLDLRLPLIVTGPRRALLAGSALPLEYAAPYGDMMLTGCFGLLRALRDRHDGLGESRRDVRDGGAGGTSHSREPAADDRPGRPDRGGARSSSRPGSSWYPRLEPRPAAARDRALALPRARTRGRGRERRPRGAPGRGGRVRRRSGAWGTSATPPTWARARGGVRRAHAAAVERVARVSAVWPAPTTTSSRTSRWPSTPTPAHRAAIRTDLAAGCPSHARADAVDAGRGRTRTASRSGAGRGLSRVGRRAGMPRAAAPGRRRARGRERSTRPAGHDVLERHPEIEAEQALARSSGGRRRGRRPARRGPRRSRRGCRRGARRPACVASTVAASSQKKRSHSDIASASRRRRSRARPPGRRARGARGRAVPGSRRSW